MQNQAELKQRFLEYYRELPIQKLAAESIGRSEDTITDWKKADSDFSDQVMLARAEWAKRNSKGVRSKEWLLERVMKDHFAPRSPLLDDNGKVIPILGDVSKNNGDQQTTTT